MGPTRPSRIDQFWWRKEKRIKTSHISDETSWAFQIFVDISRLVRCDLFNHSLSSEDTLHSKMKTFVAVLIASLALQACLVPSMASQTSTATLAISRPLAAAALVLVSYPIDVLSKPASKPFWGSIFKAISRKALKRAVSGVSKWALNSAAGKKKWGNQRASAIKSDLLLRIWKLSFFVLVSFAYFSVCLFVPRNLSRLCSTVFILGVFLFFTRSRTTERRQNAVEHLARIFFQRFNQLLLIQPTTNAKGSLNRRENNSSNDTRRCW